MTVVILVGFSELRCGEITHYNTDNANITE